MRLMLLVLFCALQTSGVMNSPRTDEAFSSLDRHWLIQMFLLRYNPEATSTDQAKLITQCPSMYGIGSDHHFFAYFARCRELQNAHITLRAKDGEYTRSLEQVRDDILGTQGLLATEREGRSAMYALLLQEGILQKIIDEAPYAGATTIPDDGVLDPWGSDERPFANGIDTGYLDPTLPKSVLPFHYCGEGIKISGGAENPFVEVHNDRYKNDPRYRINFNRTVQPFVDRAEKLSAFDFVGQAELTRDLRRALVDAGIARVLDSVVAERPGNTVGALSVRH